MSKITEVHVKTSDGLNYVIKVVDGEQYICFCDE